MTLPVTPAHNLDEIRKARLVVARVVSQCEFGGGILPIFERLDREIEYMERKNDSLKKALLIAGGDQ